MANRITSESPWGPVYIKSGAFAGRIGYLEDDDERRGAVRFGTPHLYYTEVCIPYRFLQPINTAILLKRKNELLTLLTPCSRQTGCIELEEDHTQLLDMLYEYHYVDQLLLDRWEKARWEAKSETGYSLFISHSSMDKEFVRGLAVDLADLGHNPWLDEWEILPGQSIIQKINAGINNCHFVILILSPSAVESKWVETEWHAKFWDEITTGHIRLIPILYKQCDVPSLIRPKKYVDFTYDYTIAIEELGRALGAYSKHGTKSD